jgi:hypothetical protein
MIHRGKIVENIVRTSGYSFTKLAKKLHISRNTLYNRFSNASLSYTFIMQVGHAIYHDFSIDFPEIKKEPELIDDNPLLAIRKDETSTLWKVNRKYIQLLEEYTKLLSLLVITANQARQPQLKKELMEVIEREIEMKQV